jgi:hypothetical protein
MKVSILTAFAALSAFVAPAFAAPAETPALVRYVLASDTARY